MIVQRHRELRATLIAKHSRLAAEKIEKLTEGKKKPTVEQIAAVINEEFTASQI